MVAVPQQCGTLLLCCGGYRTGSTYCYNLLGEYVEQANRGRRIGYLEPSQVPLLPEMWSVVEALGMAVGKSHNAPDTADGADVWPVLLAHERTPVTPVCTVRDFRDVLHSFSRTFDEPPEEVLTSRRWRINLVNLRWWLAQDALLVRYEDLRRAPCAVLRRVLTAAGIESVRDDLLNRAAEAASPGQATAMTQQLERKSIDARTLLHDGHVGTPSGGAWRSWSTDRLDRLRPALDPLLEEFGYVW